MKKERRLADERRRWTFDLNGKSIYWRIPMTQMQTMTIVASTLHSLLEMSSAGGPWPDAIMDAMEMVN